MSDLTKRFQKIMKDIENNISDEKQFEYINKKIAEISMLHMDIIDEMANIIKNKIENKKNISNIYINTVESEEYIEVEVIYEVLESIGTKEKL